MEKLNKILILATIFLTPVYLLKVNIFGIPSNVLEILALATFILSLMQKKLSFFNFYKNNKVIC